MHFLAVSKSLSALKEIMTDRGSMEIEAGNNALIVTDIQRVVEKIEMMVADLDRKIKRRDGSQ